jgi:riboflavin kinase/FMN adenylyltransferase
MKIITDYNISDENHRGASIAVGNFDGVHLGHQSIIQKAEEFSSNSPLGILTFSPHPREFFDPRKIPFRLMNETSRNNRLKKLGVKILYQISFNKALASLSARDFAKKVLAVGIGAKNVVIGSDFCFGKNRAGDAKMLATLGDEFGFNVDISDIVSDSNETLSSTNIRNLLSNGLAREAAKMLGHWHRLDGLVVSGDRRGRTLGYPTANISLDGLHKPKLGVYSVLVDILTGPNTGSYKGVTSVGKKPMFGDNSVNCETYLFDFTGDIYGEQISVALIDFIRCEQKFSSLTQLISQMNIDCEEARLSLEII